MDKSDDSDEVNRSDNTGESIQSDKSPELSETVVRFSTNLPVKLALLPGDLVGAAAVEAAILGPSAVAGSIGVLLVPNHPHCKGYIRCPEVIKGTSSPA